MPRRARRHLLVFLRRKKVHGRVYVYELKSYRDGNGNPRTRILRYLGPEDPRYGLAARRTRSAGEGKGRSPEEKAQQHALDREEEQVRRWLEKNRWRSVL